MVGGVPAAIGFAEQTALIVAKLNRCKTEGLEVTDFEDALISWCLKSVPIAEIILKETFDNLAEVILDRGARLPEALFKQLQNIRAVGQDAPRIEKIKLLEQAPSAFRTVVAEVNSRKMESDKHRNDILLRCGLSESYDLLDAVEIDDHCGVFVRGVRSLFVLRNTLHKYGTSKSNFKNKSRILEEFSQSDEPATLVQELSEACAFIVGLLYWGKFDDLEEESGKEPGYYRCFQDNYTKTMNEEAPWRVFQDEEIERRLQSLAWKTYVPPKEFSDHYNQFLKHQIICLQGWGGVGKTAMATTFVRMSLDTGSIEDRFDHYVIISTKGTSGQDESNTLSLGTESLVSSDETTTIALDYNATFRELVYNISICSLDRYRPPPTATEDELEEIALRVLREQKLLVIVDNFEDIEGRKDEKGKAELLQFQEFLRQVSSFKLEESESRIILTTRGKGRKISGYRLRVQELSREQSYDLLRARALFLMSSGILQSAQLNQIDAGKEHILEQLSLFQFAGGHPIVLFNIALLLSREETTIEMAIQQYCGGSENLLREEVFKYCTEKTLETYFDDEQTNVLLDLAINFDDSDEQVSIGLLMDLLEDNGLRWTADRCEDFLENLTYLSFMNRVQEFGEDPRYVWVPTARTMVVELVHGEEASKASAPQITETEPLPIPAPASAPDREEEDMAVAQMLRNLVTKNELQQSVNPNQGMSQSVINHLQTLDASIRRFASQVFRTLNKVNQIMVRGIRPESEIPSDRVLEHVVKSFSIASSEILSANEMVSSDHLSKVRFLFNLPYLVSLVRLADICKNRMNFAHVAISARSRIEEEIFSVELYHEQCYDEHYMMLLRQSDPDAVDWLDENLPKERVDNLSAGMNVLTSVHSRFKDEVHMNESQMRSAKSILLSFGELFDPAALRRERIDADNQQQIRLWLRAFNTVPRNMISDSESALFGYAAWFNLLLAREYPEMRLVDEGKAYYERADEFASQSATILNGNSDRFRTFLRRLKPAYDDQIYSEEIVTDQLKLNSRMLPGITIALPLIKSNTRPGMAEHVVDNPSMKGSQYAIRAECIYPEQLREGQLYVCDILTSDQKRAWALIREKNGKYDRVKKGERIDIYSLIEELKQMASQILADGAKPVDEFNVLMLARIAHQNPQDCADWEQVVKMLTENVGAFMPHPRLKYKPHGVLLNKSVFGPTFKIENHQAAGVTMYVKLATDQATPKPSVTEHTRRVPLDQDSMQYRKNIKKSTGIHFPPPKLLIEMVTRFLSLVENSDNRFTFYEITGELLTKFEDETSHMTRVMSRIKDTSSVGREAEWREIVNPKEFINLKDLLEKIKDWILNNMLPELNNKRTEAKQLDGKYISEYFDEVFHLLQ